MARRGRRSAAASPLLALAIARAIAMAFGFAASVWLARALGPAGLGELAMAIALCSYAIQGSEFGMRSIAIVEASRAPTLAIAKPYLSARIPLALFAAALAIAIGVWIDVAPPTALTLIALSAPAAALSLDWAPLARGDAAGSALCVIARPCVYLALLILWPAPLDATSIGLCFVGAWLASAAASWPIALGGEPARAAARAPPRALRLMARGAPMAASGVFNQLGGNLDVLVIGAAFGAAAAGGAHVAASLAAAATIAANAAGQWTLGEASRERDERRARDRALRRVLPFALFAAPCFALFAPMAAPPVFGPGFELVGQAALAFALWIALEHFAQPLQSVAAARGRCAEVARGSAAGVVAMVVVLLAAVWLDAIALALWSRAAHAAARIVHAAHAAPARPPPALRRRSLPQIAQKSIEKHTK